MHIYSMMACKHPPAHICCTAQVVNLHILNPEVDSKNLSFR